MSRASRWASIALALIAAGPAAASAQEASPVVGYSTSTGQQGARIELQFANRPSLRVALRGGSVSVNGNEVGRYTPGGSLDASWRALAARDDLSTDQFVAALKAWNPSNLTGDDASAYDTIRARLSDFKAPSVAVPPAPPTPAVAPEVTPPRGGRIAGTHYVAPAGAVWYGILALLGVAVALSGIAFGISFFAERQLDIVADTVAASFARSFFVGLFAQPLLIPAFGAMIVGLALTIVGIIAIVPAALAFVVAVCAAAIGGYLAVARVAGIRFMRKRETTPETGGFGTLKSLAYGSAVLLAIWLPAVIFGWVPVAGAILQWTAIVLTWMFATTGFGAVILTRGGLRGTFGRRYLPELTSGSWDAAPVFSTAEWLAGKGDQ